MRIRNRDKYLRTAFSFKSNSELQSSSATTNWHTAKKALVATTIISLLLLLLVFPAAFDTMFSGSRSVNEMETILRLSSRDEILKRQESGLQCSEENQIQTCPTNDRTRSNGKLAGPSCPAYFRWIHEDLRPWKGVGITREMVEDAARIAHGPVKVVIVGGRAYVEKWRRAPPSRDTYTLWGIEQLLRLYPGALPDLEMVFDHTDQPYISSTNFVSNATPPPLFKYCAHHSSLDIVFPDASFWAWPKSNIKPWGHVLRSIREGNNKIKWKDRLPYAYWRGNPKAVPARIDLLKCNVSDQNDWNTRLYIQDWDQEVKQGYPHSNIVDQCTHRYKIYVEGYTWSISDKYILACNSMTLYVNSRYYDFFHRGLVPLKHYWPIREDNKCPSLKFAVDWGNRHPEKAMEIGEAGSNFIEENLKMEFVYDYVFHLLSEYAKLLKFKPVIPLNAMELCSEKLVCPSNKNWQKWILESLVTTPSDRMPCAMPPPFDPQQLRQFLERKANASRQAEMWENEYWQNVNN